MKYSPGSCKVFHMHFKIRISLPAILHTKNCHNRQKYTSLVGEKIKSSFVLLNPSLRKENPKNTFFGLTKFNLP